ncbi:MAG: DUF4258 domain-containing protein [Candidatus Brocadia sp.]|nr:MAG: DUF4258 domain-containing protein [Candidatus Brocadia sp.]TVM03576.1 MAG: hypothetical protein CV087_04505 [Candidatus Brocadia sp. WS118]
MELVPRIKELVKNGNYRLTFHAEIERDADCISIVELEEALMHEECELVEDYPKDPRGHSFLLLGFTAQRLPIHAVCSIHEDTLVIITVYKPDSDLWIDWKIRKVRK